MDLMTNIHQPIKRDQRILSFREKLARDMKRFDTRQETAQLHHTSKACRFLALPVEIRQAILDSTLDDEEVTNVNLPKQRHRLSSVCKTFKHDMEWVFKRWQQRKAPLAVVKPGAFDSYIADLMAPILAAGKARDHLQQLGGRAAHQKRRSQLWNDKLLASRKSLSSVRSQDHIGYRRKNGGVGTSNWDASRWAGRSQTEIDEAKIWRQKRETQIEKVKASMREEVEEKTKEQKTLTKEEKDAQNLDRRKAALLKKLEDGVDGYRAVGRFC